MDESQPQGKRKVEAALWDHYKPEIKQFYSVENKTLQAVRKEMNEQHGFDRTQVFRKSKSQV